MEKISVKDRLPKNGEMVLVYLNINNWSIRNDPHKKVYFKTVIFQTGMSAEQRMKEKSGRKNIYRAEDEHGNNERAYCWKEFGPGCFNGQDVDFWFELPNMEEI